MSQRYCFSIDDKFIILGASGVVDCKIISIASSIKINSLVWLPSPQSTTLLPPFLALTIFLIKSEEIAINFLKRKLISLRDIHLTIIGEPSKLEGINNDEE